MSSRRSTSFPLNADVVYVIVLLLPDFRSLRSLSHSCRFIHNLIDTRWQGISRAVAVNEAGLALPHCLRSVAYTISEEGDHVMAEFRYPYEPSDMALDWRVALHLSKKARVARTLEDIYSWRYKDRTSRTSKLSEIEALRFQRSVYRLSLLSSAYGVGLDYRRPESDSAFLRQLPTSQLEELWETIVFLGNLSLWTSRIEAWSLGAYETGEGEGADADQWPALGAYVGPEMVLDGFQRSSIAEVRKYEVYSYSYRDFLVRPLHRLLKERWRSREASRDSRKSPFLIFDTIEGYGDRCGRCNAVSHNNLWNQSNWVLLKGELGGRIFDYLPGSLPKNPFELTCMQNFLRNMQFPDFMDELLRFNHPAYGSGDPQQWLCLKCVSSTMRERLLYWWVECTKQFQSRDCLNGYQCVAQGRDAKHALLFRHLCEPAGTRTSNK